MDRNKPGGPNRNQKKMTAHLSSEFFALGTKASREDSKAKLISSKNIPTNERKREAPTSISGVTKKLKTSSRPAIEIVATSSSSSELWEQMATECDAVDLVHKIYNALGQDDEDAVLRLLCGAIRSLASRPKTDAILQVSLLYFAKMKPSFFSHEIITSALISFLKRKDVKQTPQTYAIVTNLLVRGYIERRNWPEIFLRSYIDDAVNERLWVDNTLCSSFTKNVCQTFQTRTPSKMLLQLDCAAPISSRDIVSAIDDDSGDNTTSGTESNSACRSLDVEAEPDNFCVVLNRFSEIEHVVERCVVEAIREQLNKRQQQDNNTKNLLKFLCTTSGLSEVRGLCISRLELWIHNGKLMKFAQQLLSYICFNINAKNYKDHEVLAMLVKMRLKTKPLINFYMSCLREVVALQSDILRIILKFVIQNELSNTRNPNNMGMLAAIFQTVPDQSASYLAEIYKEFLLQRDDCLRSLRVFLRELVRLLRFDFNIVKFCNAFLNQRSDLTKQFEQSEFLERIFYSMVDITCLCMLLTVSPQVREVSIRSSRDVKTNALLVKFYSQTSEIQLEAVSWMYETVPHVFKLKPADYNQALHKLLLLEPPEQYSRFDQWPTEPERATLLRLVAETPVHEETLLRIILIGITKDISLSVPDSIDIIMLIVKRASAIRVPNISAIHTSKIDIIDFLFSMTEYHHPENIKLPADYDPPKLAITTLYWKVWLIMLMISAHNPSTFGAFCWNHYPTMKMLIEMCITSQFEDYSCLKDELQIETIERSHILELENYLATQPITEENAILISQLMLLDPMGQARKMPANFLEQLKYMNKTLKLGHLLCRSRKPDMLLDIIQRQGTTQSMPWLSDLVQNSEGDLNHLPVQCLCEFLLFNANSINEENSRDAELVNFLRDLVTGADSDKHTVCEVLDYIFRRLSSTTKNSRVAALAGIKIIFDSKDVNTNDWLLTSIPQIPHFKEAREFIIPQLRAACQVENLPELVMSYIQFIAANTLEDPVVDMLHHVIDMAQLIVERSTLFQHIVPSIDANASMGDEDEETERNKFQTLKCLFVMFNNYIIKLREIREPYDWAEYPDLLMVQFEDGVQLPLHLSIIHAFIILLTHANVTMVESMPILDYWFPPGRPAPVAFLSEMPHEPVQILPDWLKLKMIRSPVERLIEAAICKLTPDQIVLFVQNFGTPVNSMSKLLALLDHAVIEQYDAVKEAILNKAYLAQLIEIQQARGAKNGHFTVRALELHADSQSATDTPKLNRKNLESICLDNDELTNSKYQSSSPISGEEKQKIAQKVLENVELNDKDSHQYRRLIHHVMESTDKRRPRASGMEDESSQVLPYVDKFADKLNLKNSTDFRSRYHTYSLLRTLTQSQRNATGKRPASVANQQKVQKFNKLAEASVALPKEHRYFKTLSKVFEQPSNIQSSKTPAVFLKTSLKEDILQQFLTTSSSKAASDQKSLSIHSPNNLSTDGLLVDWLIKIDPEILIINQKLRIQFLFSKQSRDFRFYLLSLLCHQTNWHTLIYTLKDLFSERHSNLDNTAVLNFLEAIINNPRVWQGRDKTVSKSLRTEAIFDLDEREREALMLFIIDEGIADSESLDNRYDYKLCSRINLLFQVSKIKSYEILSFVQFITQSCCSSDLKLKILQQMYLMYPSIKFITYNQNPEKNAKLLNLKGCRGDKVINYLITCLASLTTKKDFEMLSSDTELLLRKIAASHPALFLRQLGVLSSLIQGKGHINFRALREEFHFHRFIQIIRIMELLQPTLFEDAYKQELQSTLSSYFVFFEHHSNAKEAYQILLKFIDLLQTYINTNPSSALPFIETYVHVLMNLSIKFHSMHSLHHLVQGISLMQHKTLDAAEMNDDAPKNEFEFEEATDVKGTAAGNAASSQDSEAADTASSSTANATVDVGNRGSYTLALNNASYAKTNNIPIHFMNLIKIIKNSDAEDTILAPLQEIESLTSKRFSFLNEIFDRLLELIFSPSAQIRSNAFILLIRHLKFNPGRLDINRCALNAYIQCLRDDNSSVASTAIDNLPEITLLLQEHAVEILSVAFSLGIKSRLNTAVQIKRILQTLMLQHGY